MHVRTVIVLALATAGFGFLAGRYSAPDVPSAPPAVPLDHEVKVVRVGDGDTIEVTPLSNPDRKEKVRLLGLNAPGKGEKHFEDAQKALAALVADKEVMIEYEEKGVPARDEHNRVLAYVFINGTNTSVEMVRKGWSAFSTKHGGARFADELNKAEAEAKAAGAGVWSGK